MQQCTDKQLDILVCVSSEKQSKKAKKRGTNCYMRDVYLYREMITDADNYSSYIERLNKNIDRVKNRIPVQLYAVLKEYELSFDEYSQRFYDFDNKEFRKHDFELFITGFCDRIETIEIMLGML